MCVGKSVHRQHERAPRKKLQLHVYSYCSKLGGGDFRLIYRHYATLYFVFCVDSSESELGILDLIQVRYSRPQFVGLCMKLDHGYMKPLGGSSLLWATVYGSFCTLAY